MAFANSELMKRMADIRQMHRDISRITENKDRKCIEYLDDFVETISHLIERLEFFSDHNIWECISQKLPEGNDAEQSILLHGMIRRGGLDEYLPIPLTREEFIEKSQDYFQDGTLEKIFEIPAKSGHSYFNLPVFSEDEQIPQWILTLAYREEDLELVDNEDFFQFMEHLSHEIGTAWGKFQENVAAELQTQIDYKLAWGEKTESDSAIDQLNIITRVLARELKVDLCAFFLVNEDEKMLNMEAVNRDLSLQLDFSLSDGSNIFANSFNRNETFRLMGRKNLEEIVKPEIVKPAEKAIRETIKKKKLKQGKRHFTPYVLFEHALLFPITYEARKPGIIGLFRSKPTQKPEPPDRFENVTRPFAEFETNLLRRVQRYVFYIFISHDAVQKRMRDTRNMIAQVISPISALISSTRSFARKPLPGEPPPEKVSDTLKYINALSIIANQYITNFEKLLDIDTQSLKLHREKIPDLRKYLIDTARLYIPLSRKKFIHINVTKETPDNIQLEVDRDLFDVVILNIIDNAVKYSFEPEVRSKHGLQAKPASMEDKENILITAEQDSNSITITVSSCGIEILEPEREKIFERDFRGTYAREGGKGSGLGLYLAKEIIEKHEGTIELVPNTSPYNIVFRIRLLKREKW